MMLYLKLRNNIYLESDIQLARREVSHLFKNTVVITKYNISEIPSFVLPAYKLSNTRKGHVVGFVATDPKVSIKRLALLLSFIQEIWCDKNEVERTDYSSIVGSALCIVPLMAMSEFLSYVPNIGPDSSTEIINALLDETKASSSVIKSVKRSNTSSPHLHSFHKFKAKFFPRFVRSLIVSNLKLDKKDLTICDPYVGSGTTLIESALLGYHSFGFDIDPISCLISETKAQALNTAIDDLKSYNTLSIDSKSKRSYCFPTEIMKKFQRWDSLNEMAQYEQEISKTLEDIDNEVGLYKRLHQIALSDALTRKFKIRLMGTGSGRFALEIGKTSLSDLIKSNIIKSIHGIRVIEYIRKLYGIHIPPPKVYNGDAINRSCNNDSCDIIVTSPPYLPASSGREDYLIGKFFSSKALGLHEYKDYIMANSVGSMTFHDISNLSTLPQSVHDLYNWLLNDDLRNIKAGPIAAYYNSLRNSLLEDKRTIKKDGKIIYIIGKESVFYKNSTREILYKVNCDKIFIEIVNSIGLKVDEIINVELDKKNALSRPRSSDKYYETALIMSK